MGVSWGITTMARGLIQIASSRDHCPFVEHETVVSWVAILCHSGNPESLPLGFHPRLTRKGHGRYSYICQWGRLMDSCIRLVLLNSLEYLSTTTVPLLTLKSQTQFHRVYRSLAQHDNRYHLRHVVCRSLPATAHLSRP